MAEGEGGGPVGAIVTADGHRVQIALDPVTIGRHPDCDVVLNDQEVSRQHAEVRRDDADFVIIDLGSLNGTKVNGAGVKSPRALQDGDTITIGAHTMRFEAS
jgi:pSer/pThr/pTyr-binding forkhead associated (FHA) protein